MRTIQRRPVSVLVIGVLVALGLCVAPGDAAAQQNLAWDMVASGSQNLVSYGTDAPTFGSPGDGFQKYQVGVSSSIPYSLLDDSGGSYPPDELGIIDSSSDSDEFFGATDTENGDNTGPVTATWVFDTSAAAGRDLAVSIDMGAMGDFEAEDSFEWRYSFDGAPATLFLQAVADEDGSQTYTLADGDSFTLDDPLTVAGGGVLTNNLTTFTETLGTGSQLTITLTVVTNGGSEAFVARDIVVSLADESAGSGIPAMSPFGIAVMALLVLGGGVFLLRRVS